MDFEPKWVAWEITRRCNLRCVHCRSSSLLEAGNHPDFSLHQARLVLDDIASYASPVVVLSGGEPLLRPDVFDIARHGTALGLRMCMATNGTLVTEAVCDGIKDSGIKMVSLSLDGARAETHDNFRNQAGAFAGTMNAIRLFNERGIPFLVNSSFTVRNREEIPDIYRLVKQLGAKAWYMFMIVPTGRGEDIMDELIPEDIYDEILDWHYRVEKEEDELLMRPTCAPHYYRIVRQKAKEEGSSFKRRNLQVLDRRLQGLPGRPADLPDRRRRRGPALQLLPQIGGQCFFGPRSGRSGRNPSFSCSSATSRVTRTTAAAANTSGSAAVAGPGPTP